MDTNVCLHNKDICDNAMHYIIQKYYSKINERNFFKKHKMNATINNTMHCLLCIIYYTFIYLKTIHY